MIVTVTMNPAIDKTVEVDTLARGSLNRIKRVEYDAGGKGINVSRTIRELGGVSMATGFLGGNNGRIIEKALRSRDIVSDFVWVEGETRTNTKIFEASGELTELNEPGPVISREKLEELLQKLTGYAGGDTLFILSGSIPRGVDTDIYGEIIRLVHKKGSRVLLDADGELFRRALEAGPDMIKPNRAELEEYAGIDYWASEEELLQIAERLAAQGMSHGAVSLGKGGALFLLGDFRAKCPSLSVQAHSTVGAGDAMVAALAYAWSERLDGRETVRLCMAASAGAVTTIGTKPPAKALIEELKEQVMIEEL